MDYGQTQAGPDLASRRASHRVEAVEDVGQVLGRDPGAVVLDPHEDVAFTRAGADGDVPARELQGVLHEVGHDLGQTVGIGRCRRDAVAGDVDLQDEAGVACCGPKPLGRAGHDVGDVGRPEIEGEAPGV